MSQSNELTQNTILTFTEHLRYIQIEDTIAKINAIQNMTDIRTDAPLHTQGTSRRQIPAWDSNGLYIGTNDNRSEFTLIAKKVFNPRDFITSFGGERSTKKPINRKFVIRYQAHDKEDKNKTIYLDGRELFRVREKGRWIRTAETKEEANCTIKRYINDDFLYAQCTKEIKFNDEVLLEPEQTTAKSNTQSKKFNLNPNQAGPSAYSNNNDDDVSEAGPSSYFNTDDVNEAGPSSYFNDDDDDADQAPPIPIVRKKSVSKSKKAGLQFPVGRVNRRLRIGLHRTRVGENAPVYLAAVLEYLAAEVLELAGNATKDFRKKIITPRHITLAVRNDEELNKFLSRVIIPSGGVLPHIEKSLLPKPKKTTASRQAIQQQY